MRSSKCDKQSTCPFINKTRIRFKRKYKKIFKSIKKTFVQNLLNYDVENMPFSIMKKLKKFFDTHPDCSNIKDKSMPAAAIYNIMHLIYQKRLLIERLKRSQNRYPADTNQTLATKERESILHESKKEVDNLGYSADAEETKEEIKEETNIENSQDTQINLDDIKSAIRAAKSA